MKKFKLIKEYPGVLIKIGDVVIQQSPGWYFPENGGNGISGEHVENYPEFWREIEELCVPLGTKFTSKMDGVNEYVYTLQSIELAAFATDNTYVLVTWNCTVNGKTGVLYSIKEINKYFSKGNWVVYNEPVKLFTTEDEFDIYEGDTYWYMCIPPVWEYENCWNPLKIEKAGITDSYEDELYRTFSTEKAAEDYVLMNKPCLSIKEIAPIVGIPISRGRFVYPSDLLESLKALVKTKL